jgi:hypothetical protein
MLQHLMLLRCCCPGVVRALTTPAVAGSTKLWQLRNDIAGNLARKAQNEASLGVLIAFYSVLKAHATAWISVLL